MAVGTAAVQQSDPFITLVRAYRTRPDAVLDLLQLRRQDLESGVRECLSVVDAMSRRLGCTPRELMAAAVMLTHGAANVSEGSLAVAYVRAGGNILRPLASPASMWPPDVPSSVSRFGPLWYAHAGRTLLARREPNEARKTVLEGLDRYPQSPDLHLALGVIGEVSVSWSNGEGRGDFADRYQADFINRQLMPVFRESIREYERALAIAPSFAGAHLRLAWTYLLTHDERAERELSVAARAASNADESYQIHLLRAALAERRGRFADAAEQYRAARVLGPHYSSACVGLSHAQLLTGDLAAAEATAVTCLTLPIEVAHPDPWMVLRSGITDTATMEWLQSEVRR